MIINLIKRSILAGVMISLGGYIYLMTYTDNKYIASALFSIGLLSILYLQYDLFTGKVCNIVSNLSVTYTISDRYYVHHNQRPIYKPNNPLYYIIVLIGNLFGCFMMAGIPHLTMSKSSLEYVNSLCVGKISKSPSNLFCSAIVCEICIAIAIWIYNSAKEKNTNIIVTLAVMVFIISGSEHCIADGYYFMVDLINNFSVKNLILYSEALMIVIMGNLLGGILMNLLNIQKQK